MTSAQPRDALEETPPFSGYAGEHRPLAAYAVLTAIFNALLGAFLVRFLRSGRELPERIGLGDVALGAAATHKLSRSIAKDKVTSPVRAPFTRYEGPAGPSEVSEEPRGSGFRLALGELLGCPWCVGQWVAAAYTCGLVVAPRPTRFLATIFAIHGLSDSLQVAYKLGEEKL